MDPKNPKLPCAKPSMRCKWIATVLSASPSDYNDLDIWHKTQTNSWYHWILSPSRIWLPPWPKYVHWQNEQPHHEQRVKISKPRGNTTCNPLHHPAPVFTQRIPFLQIKSFFTRQSCFNCFYLVSYLLSIVLPASESLYLFCCSLCTSAIDTSTGKLMLPTTGGLDKASTCGMFFHGT